MQNHVFQVGILGCGMIANVHANAVSSLPNAAPRGVADARVESAQQFAQSRGVLCYHDYEEMLSDPLVDVVCICTPSGFHAENAIAALEHGKHVVLEKPMALSTKSADEIIAACQKSGKHLTVISQLRFSKDVLRVKQLLDEGAFGTVSLCSLFMKYYRSKEYYASSPWKGTKRFDGGGALMNQGIHGVDLLEYIVGPVKTVKGQIKTLCHNIEVEDTAAAVLEFENGALGVIEASTCAFPGFERRLEIHGDCGYVMLKDNRIEKLMIRGEEIPTNVVDGVGTANDPSNLKSEMHAMQISNLLAAVEGKESLLVDCHEGRRAIALIESIYQQ